MADYEDDFEDDNGQDDDNTDCKLYQTFSKIFILKVY